MKKLTKKQGIIIGIVVAVVLVVAIVFGMVFAGNNTNVKDENKPKTETITDKETDKDINENIENESEEEDKTGTTEDDTQSETTDDTQSSTEEAVVTKTTMYAKSNVNVRNGAGTSNSQIGSLTKGQEVVKIGEENGWSKIEFNGGVGYVKSSYLSTEKVTTSTNNSSTGNGNNTAPSTSSPVGTPTETKPSVTECEHWYQPEEQEEYDSIKHYIYGCNGCGYPLFTIEGHDAVNLPDLYFHPPYYSEKLGRECTGGAYHSETYYQGYCATCHDEIQLRACTYFYVMAENCIKNEGTLGSYEKVESGHAYIISCSCGQNILLTDGATGKGLKIIKEVCSYCGDVKTYPEQ